MVMNATGWTQMMDGNLVSAAFTMYDAAFVGWTVGILFFVYELMLLIKTRNLPLAFITGMFFASMYITSTFQFVKPISSQIIFVLLVFELAGILYLWLWK